MDVYQKKLKNLGHIFRELRHAHKWTLEDVEEHGWHDWKYLQKIESGQNITLKTFLQLCSLYNIAPSKFFRKLEKFF